MALGRDAACERVHARAARTHLLVMLVFSALVLGTWRGRARTRGRWPLAALAYRRSRRARAQRAKWYFWCWPALSLLCCRR